MTTPTTPRPAPEAVEAAMRWATDKGTAEDHEILAGDDPYCPETDTAARILAAEVEWLTCEAGHYKELLESIKNLCEGNGVGLREDVLDILKKM